MGTAGGKRRAPSSGAGSRWRRFAIRLLAVCVLGVLVGAGWQVVRPRPGRTLTTDGRTVSNASTLLSRTEAATRQLVRDRHGVLAADSRCYYTSAATGAGPLAADAQFAGAAFTGGSEAGVPIGDRMLCGPLLLVDGDPGRPYLTYDLLASPDGSRIRLAASSPDGDPTSADPRPAGQLVRPDGKQPPARYALRSPAPPAAVGDVLTTTATLHTPITPAPSDAVMVGQLSGVRLVEYGFVGEYGWADQARAAPPGYRLLAFAVEPVPGELADGTPNLSVRVDGQERGPLAMTSDYLVAAVPKQARQVDLVLTDSGVKQSVSLLTGRPAAANPAVTVRSHDQQQLGVSRPIRVQLRTAAGSGVLTGTLTVRQVSLSYWAADGSCPKPDRAWLHIGALLRLDGDKQPYAVEPALISVTLPGAGQQATSNAAADPATGVDDVVDVPAGLTDGSISFDGSVKTAKGTLTVLTPVTVPFTIPAG